MNLPTALSRSFLHLDLSWLHVYNHDRARSRLGQLDSGAVVLPVEISGSAVGAAEGFVPDHDVAGYALHHALGPAGCRSTLVDSLTVIVHAGECGAYLGSSRAVLNLVSSGPTHTVGT